MKKIKFRVWDKETKKWIDDSDIAINQKGLLFIRYKWGVEFQPMSLTKSSNFEVVFFTGLKDKNKKEIFEGDIVKLSNGQNGEVYFEDGRWNIKGNHIAELTELGRFISNHYPLELIGNIYENPELLNEKGYLEWKDRNRDKIGKYNKKRKKWIEKKLKEIEGVK